MMTGDLPGLFLFLGLAAAFMACAGANLSILLGLPPDVKRARAQGRTVSMVPFLGGGAGAAACLVGPFPELRPFFWVPLVADPGTSLYLGAVAGAVIKDTLKGLPFRRAGAGVPTAEPTDEAVRLRRALAGCLLGTAVGDAVGLPVEGLSRRRQRRLCPDLDGHRLLLRRGMTSDDTEHTCMVAQAVILSHGYPDPFSRDLAWRLRFWLLGIPAGVGFATLRAILKLWIGFPPHRSGVRSAGNGPAMRSALLGVCFGHDEERLRTFVRASTRITHDHDDAEAGALAVAVAASCAAEGTTGPRAYLARVEAALGDREGPWLQRLREVAESAASGEPTEAFADRLGCQDGVSGYILHTVPVALHAWLRNPHDLKGGVLEVVHLGGDTDTTAAIVGAITGAGVGREGIPPAWLDGLVEWPRSVSWMEGLAGELTRVVMEVRRGEAPSPVDRAAVRTNPVAVVLRNLVFLIVVLTHGFRRLLPPY